MDAISTSMEVTLFRTGCPGEAAAAEADESISIVPHAES